MDGIRATRQKVIGAWTRCDMSRNSKAGELAREITALFEEQNEVVLETTDIQEFLSNGRPVDSILAMEVVRDIAERNHWNSFVYDYGALVQFTRKNGVNGNGIGVHKRKNGSH